MDLVPGPGFAAYFGLATAVKGFKASDSRLPAEVAGDKFLELVPDDRIERRFPAGCEQAGLLQEFVVNFEC
jgi:hypothetical protein